EREVFPTAGACPSTARLSPTIHLSTNRASPVNRCRSKMQPAPMFFSGSINQSGAIEVVTERLGRDTNYGKITEAVERAEQSRAPVQRLAGRMAGYLVFFALAAGTPLAILGAIGRAARFGAIVEGGVHPHRSAAWMPWFSTSLAR